MNKTKIEWCDMTINPVVGCGRGCPYCYAKKLNDRFHFIEDFTKPQFFLERLKQLDKIKNKVIFMNSMSDISCWTQLICNQVKNAIINNNTNTYIFLTKCFGENIGYGFTGLTIDSQQSLDDCLFDMETLILDRSQFINIEPLLSTINIIKAEELFKHKKWIIIGAETGNRKDKVIPKKEWIDNILNDLKEIGYTGKIFMKNNLKDIYPNLIQEYPFERGK